MKKLLTLLTLLIFTSGLIAQIGFEEYELLNAGSTSFNIGDIDGDNDLDILTYSGGSLVWTENIDGHGNFENYIQITPSYHGGGNVELKDIDGDGDLDVIELNGSEYIHWFENLDGLGNFGPSQNINETELINYGGLLVADLDGDGDLDVVTSNDHYEPWGNHKIIWCKNLDGQGTFQELIIESNMNFGGAAAINAGDMDGDGDLDLIVATTETGSNISWFENTDGLGDFGPRQIILTGLSHTINAVDLDGDNDLDILVDSKWFENIDNQGNFIEHNFLFGANFEATYFGDVDGDGDLDIFVNYDSFDGTAYLAWVENLDGQGDFGTLQFITEIYFPRYFILSGDINGDGSIDVLSSTTSDSSLSWYKNIGPIGNKISGKVNLDYNDDGCDFISDLPLKNFLVTSDNGNNSFSTFTNDFGQYSFTTNPGMFTTSVQNPDSEVYGINPLSHISVFPGLDGVDVAHFCMNVVQDINDVNIAIYPQSDAQPGFESEYRIYFQNVGSTSLSGTISLNFNEDKLNFLTASETVSSQSDGILTFDYADFFPFQSDYIDITFLVEPPPITEIDDILTFTTEITPIVGDATENDNIYILNQTVVGSFDPNDIIVLEGEEIYLDEADEYLHYMIRFQNVGTAHATFIRVTNQLDEDLDWSTLQMESVSHDYSIEIIDGNDITFFFDAIYLPDSTADEENSHGFITYKIKPKNPANIGDVFTNSANIYFDYNPPVATNTVTTTIVEDLSVSDHALNDLKIYPNPSNGLLNIQSNATIVSVEVINQLGQVVISSTNSEGINSMNIENLQQGLYFIKLKDSHGNSLVKKLLKE